MLVRLRRPKALTVGDEAPDFELFAANGKPFKLSQARGHLVLLAFFPCTWCGTCSIRARSYEREAAALAQFDLRTVVVGVPGAPSAEEFARALGLNPLVLVDEDGQVTKTFARAASSRSTVGGEDARPAAVLVDRDGRVLFASRCDEPGAFVEPQELLSVLEATPSARAVSQQPIDQ